MGADIVALQEVDHRAARTGHVNQPKALGAALGFQYAFAATIRLQGGDYGLAVVSRWPLAKVVRHALSRPTRGEPRIVLDTVVCAPGGPIRLLNHHADTRPAARRGNLEKLEALARAHSGGLVVAGDFNDTPDASAIHGLVSAGLTDPLPRGKATSFQGRIDYLLLDRSLAPRASGARIWKSRKSDHFAVVVDIRR
jgi:endonuclease/exonuclease/phosphatase family metal-dependent hydrolase